MIEFLIKGLGGARLEIEEELVGAVLTPTSVPFEVASGWGTHRLRVGACEISFSFEDAGIQLLFDGDIEPELAMSIAEEILANVERATAHRAALVEL